MSEEEAETRDAEAHDTAPSDPALTLAAALAQRQIELPEEQVALLDRYRALLWDWNEKINLYRALLWDWNEKINLTRHTTMEKFVERDVVDSLAFSEFLQTGEHVLDVGTGGGVPGVILGIVRPDLHIELSESVGKRARVVGEIIAALGLNITMHHGAAQAVLENQVFDALVVRAVASLSKLLTWFEPHWASIGRLLVLKGPAWVEERGEARHLGQMHYVQLRKLSEYPLPGTESHSVLLELRAKE
ncbi:MAG: 16S rRNA (guanine(527)-N(7))-methyltransferase RsmG [Planctomycetia bacterium]|nr:16S rRNA (guanine(527)-N(7))-methyltransferase RsmG [Planctomycetia bacterium]